MLFSCFMETKLFREKSWLIENVSFWNGASYNSFEGEKSFFKHEKC